MKLFLTSILCSVYILSIFFIAVFLVHIFNPLSQHRLSGESIWMEGAGLPNPRTEVTAANLDETVYVIGGFTFDGKITDIVEMYNSTDNTWVQNIKSLPLPLHHASSDIYGGKIYVVGDIQGIGSLVTTCSFTIQLPIIGLWVILCLHHEVRQMQISLMEYCM